MPAKRVRRRDEPAPKRIAETPRVAESRPEEEVTSARDLLLRMQGTVGNQAVTRMVGASSSPGALLQRQKTKPRTISFDDPDVIEVTTHTTPKAAEGSGIKEINLLVEDQRTNLENTREALRTGIDNFADYQKFASSAEAKADYAGAVMKFATKLIIEEALKLLAKSIPGVDKVYKITFGLLEELEKEHKRAAKAASEVEARDFIVKYRTLITDFFNARIDEVPKVREELAAEYERLGAAHNGGKKKGKPGPAGWVVGAQAELLQGVRQAFKAYRAPTSDQCLKVFTETWVMQAEGQLMSRGGGDMYYDGKILLEAKILKDGDNYKITSLPEKGTLLSPRADKTVDALTRLFSTGTTKDTNGLRIMKDIEIEVEDEIDWDFNDYYRLHVKFRDPADPDVGHTIPSPVRGDRPKKAPAIGKKAFELIWADTSKLGVTKLKAGSRGERV
jgi:hypothetical protein